VRAIYSTLTDQPDDTGSLALLLSSEERHLGRADVLDELPCLADLGLTYGQAYRQRNVQGPAISICVRQGGVGLPFPVVLWELDETADCDHKHAVWEAWVEDPSAQDMETLRKKDRKTRAALIKWYKRSGDEWQPTI